MGNGDTVKKNKVVIITYDMIPHASTWGGSQRMYYLAEYLMEKGLKVTVFSCMKNNNETYGNKITFEHYSIPVKNKLYYAILSSKTQNTKNCGECHSSTYKYLNLVRKLIKNNQVLFKTISKLETKIFNEPGFLAGFISRSWSSGALNQIVDYISKNKINQVIISAPPFGMFSIAEALKKNINRLNIIFDYRDPWNLWRENSIIARYLEQKYLQFADIIVCTNQNLVNDIAKKFEIDINKFQVIENGYSAEAWSKIDSKNIKTDSMIMTYVGTMDMSISSHYGYRDISILLKVVKRCLNEGMKINLKFVGVTNPDSEYSNQLKSKFGGNIEIIGVIENRKANKYMVESDVLLLLHTTNDNSSKYLVSGKMYDYIRANKFIFSIGSSFGIHKEMISTLKLGISTENTEEEIYDSLCYIYSLWKDGLLKLGEFDITKYSRETQNEKYYEIITNTNPKEM